MLDPANTVQHAFLDSAGKMVDLGLLPGTNFSEAMGINNSGTIVGDSQGRLVIWQKGSILDVNNLLKDPPGFLLSYAAGINDLGQIVGYTYDSGGHAHGFLLSPGVRLTLGGLAPNTLRILAPKPGW